MSRVVSTFVAKTWLQYSVINS